MQKKNRYRLLFTKKTENTISAMPLQPIKIDTVLQKWYRSITELPLNKFIDISVDDNLSALIISGFPSQSDLLNAWADIQQEYADVVGNSLHRIYLKKLIEVTQSKLRLQCIEDMIELLGNVWYKGFQDILEKELRCKLNLDYKNNEAYTKELKRAYLRSRGLKIALDLLELNFKGMADKMGASGKNPTREYYYSYLYTLSDHAKFEIRDTITVHEFATRVKRFSEYCDAVNKK